MSAALIIIDLIEDLIGPKGRANHCREQVAATHLLANVNAAAAYARVRKIPVIWVRVGFATIIMTFRPIRRCSTISSRSAHCG